MMPMSRGVDGFLFKPWNTGVDVYVASHNSLPLFKTDPSKISLINEKQTRMQKIKAHIIVKFLTPIRYFHKKNNRRKMAYYRETLGASATPK